MDEKLYSIQIEQSVLSSLMSLTDGVDEVIGRLSEDSFYAVKHQIIFKNIKKLFNNGAAFDVIAVYDEIKLDANDSKLVDEKHMLDLMGSSSSAILLDKHADRLIEHARRRALFVAGERIKTISVDTTQYDVDAAISASGRELSSVDNDGAKESMYSAYSLSLKLFESINQRMIDRQNGVEKINGVRTGFDDLDRQIGTISKSDLVIIAARPSMGKTAFAQDLMMYISFFEQHPVLFQSAEMSKDKIMARIISSMATINSRHIRDADIPPEKWKDFNDAVFKLEKSKIMIDDTSSPTISHIRKNCRKLRKDHGYVGAVFVDYLTLITPPLKTDQNHLAVGSISKALKALAKEFDCPVFALSQLSRNLEQRGDKRPMMSDLRESGQIEQDADVILFLYRDEYYNKTSKELGVAEIIAAKVRDGEVGTIRLATELQYSRFVTLDSSYYQMVSNTP